MESYLAHEIESANLQAQYDKHAKQLLKDKGVLARILIGAVREFMQYTVEEAIAAIEGEPEVSAVPVRPHSKPEAIDGTNTESSLPGEGSVYFDIVFIARTKDGSRTKIYINVEAQKSFYPGYDLVTRAVVYAARLISHQLDREFTPNDYDQVKKVYSIWICMNVPGESHVGGHVTDCIFEYKMTPQILYCADPANPPRPENWRYDLMDVIFVCTSEKVLDSSNQLIGMLSTLLSAKLNVDEKKERLSNLYGFQMSREMEKEAAEMCNISGTIAWEKDEIILKQRHEIEKKDKELSEQYSKLLEKDSKLSEQYSKIAALEAKLKAAGIQV